ncbi:MAG TPA: maltose alpha-D-glucosyltransferase [Alphaproteobacteria bacterium]
MLADDPLWYKDVIIYEVHVKAFYDSNGDGLGDFVGLTEKLDYLQDLGVTAIWVLPFYPSPLRDDGYDIADYTAVNPAYGTMRDFSRFVREAHRRNIRVITELVINHTSDQHPWFQRARRARPGSSYRNWYVWSDTDQRYAGTRIIFRDTEPSNWAWDPVAKQYYWHRFFSHQPDLNFDNPQVVRAVINVMRFWLDLGVDGLRLDAIPYLCEREGTNNENLPETHERIRKLRLALDERHKNRMFIAEANQWPEDVQQYFGNGDECHMAYHFPLMPRMYMAIAREDRHAITDILRQTPEIPETCQWGVFLRNHDELTLEMVTDSERDYLWNTYASDPRARLNLGIRRRLAPLMENDRRKIELMNSLLLSMPGTPILYYGDEIGMGDNIFLGDRNGVRTPMQWTPDRNGGFSRADPAQLYLPPLMDPVYGYHAINVEAQSRSPSSLLNWTKRMIAVRQTRKVFGRGSLKLIYPKNRRILAYLREYEDETVLCVANLSRYPQPVELDLSHHRGQVPVELTGRVLFPQIGAGPYVLTCPGYAFYWFLLADPAKLRDDFMAAPDTVVMPEYVTIIWSRGWSDVVEGRGRATIERDVLPAYLPQQRWFSGKDAVLQSCAVATTSAPASGQNWLLTLVEVRLSDHGSTQRYFLPLAAQWKAVNAINPSSQPYIIAKLRQGSNEGVLLDAASVEEFIVDLLDHIGAGRAIPATNGTFKFTPTRAIDRSSRPEQPVIRLVGREQTNTSVLVEDYVVVKLYRAVHAGIQPEIEMGRFLTDEAQFANTPPVLGTVEHIGGDGTPTALAIVHGFVRNQGDGWSQAMTYLGQFLDECALLPVEEVEARPDRHALYLTGVQQLGIRTAEMHKALAIDTEDPSFRPEQVTTQDIDQWRMAAHEEAERALAVLAPRLVNLDPDARRDAEFLIAHRDQIFARIDDQVPDRVAAMKTRLHGDFHLGQVLVVQQDFFIIDFEGEPHKAFEQRRVKHSPLKDVAGLLRSFDYAAWAALSRVVQDHPHRRELFERQAMIWRDQASAAFLRGYTEASQGCRSVPEDEGTVRKLLVLFMLEKIFYELRYEIANRPSWVGIPLSGAMTFLFPESLGAGHAP